MKYQIFGTVMPMIEIEPNVGKRYSQSAMQWMDEAILMQTEMRGGF